MSLCYRGISLRPMRDDDMPFLFRLYTNPARCHLWMPSRRVYDEIEFRETWNSWVSGAPGIRLLVERVERPVGLVMTYDQSVEHGFAKVGAILEENSVGQGGGVIATALLMDYLFRSLPLRKIYHEVFGYNPSVVRMWRKIGLVEEGLLKGNCFWDGTYWDQHIFAIYREAWPDLRARVLRPERPRVHSPPDGVIDRVAGAESSKPRLGENRGFEDSAPATHCASLNGLHSADNPLGS